MKNSTAQSSGSQEEKRHGRKYGEKESRPIPLWNGIFDHYSYIGDAIWEFVWCIDRVTKERGSVGLVFGGAPVKLSSIIQDLKGSNRETVRRHMDLLEKANYIRRRRTPYGCLIEVLNSCKFGIWKHSKEKPQNEVSLSREKHGFVHEIPKFVQEKPQNEVSKEDSAMTLQKDTAVEAAAAAAAPPCQEKEATERCPEAWSAIGERPFGPKWFALGWEKAYQERPDGELLSDTMEEFAQACQAKGLRAPKKFFDAKRKVEKQESMNRLDKCLESEDWLETESDEVARVAGPRGVDARWAHLMKDPLEPQEARRSVEPVIDADIAQQLLGQFPEAWDTVAA